MTKSEHEKERRAFWDARFLQFNGNSDNCAFAADKALAERDKRFPAPESETI